MGLGFRGWDGPVEHEGQLVPFNGFKWRDLSSVCTWERSGSGNPKGGMPRYPWKYSTTEDGKDSSSALLFTSSSLSLFWTLGEREREDRD